MNWKEKRELKNRTRPPSERWRQGLPAELANEHLADLLSAFALEHTTKTRSGDVIPGGLRELPMTLKLVELFGRRYGLAGTVRQGHLYAIDGQRPRKVMSVYRGKVYNNPRGATWNEVGSFHAGDVRFVMPWTAKEKQSA